MANVIMHSYTEYQNTCEFYVHVVHRSLATLQDAILLSHARHINKQEQVRGQILIRLYSHFTGIEYLPLFTLHGINEKISRFKRTYYACLLHV